MDYNNVTVKRSHILFESYDNYLSFVHTFGWYAIQV